MRLGNLFLDIGGNFKSLPRMSEPTNIIPFQFGVKLVCPDCKGNGVVNILEKGRSRVVGIIKCKRCNGSGKIGAK